MNIKHIKLQKYLKITEKIVQYICKLINGKELCQ